ncbi:MAG: hypothetical protein IJE07_09640 [Clostridia bacterium]|nr:hypothetical protein [Clostridia bacterium]
MFGYVRPDLTTLTEGEQARYRSVYCGLCHALGKRHGQLSRLMLTYDLTYLTLFLSSLYEPEEATGEARCLPHPVKKHAWAASSITDYAADMTIALTYHKCRDDWADDRSLPAKATAALLKKHYAHVKNRWPRQCAAIEAAMEEQAEIEKRRDDTPDAAPACFGRLMAALFVMEADFWAPALAAFGDSLGRYIYMLDAVCDQEKDSRKGSYNPVLLMGREPEDMRPTLEMLLGGASVAFERLPLVQDEGILRNILYSGLWQGYDDCLRRREKARMKKRNKDKESEVDGHGE